MQPGHPPRAGPQDHSCRRLQRPCGSALCLCPSCRGEGLARRGRYESRSCSCRWSGTGSGRGRGRGGSQGPPTRGVLPVCPAQHKGQALAKAQRRPGGVGAAACLDAIWSGAARSAWAGAAERRAPGSASGGPWRRGKWAPCLQGFRCGWMGSRPDGLARTVGTTRAAGPWCGLNGPSFLLNPRPLSGPATRCPAWSPLAVPLVASLTTEGSGRSQKEGLWDAPHFCTPSRSCAPACRAELQPRFLGLGFP